MQRFFNGLSFDLLIARQKSVFDRKSGFMMKIRFDFSIVRNVLVDLLYCALDFGSSHISGNDHRKIRFPMTDENGVINLGACFLKAFPQ